MSSLFIVDTNVLVSGLLSGNAEGPTARLVDAMLDGSLIFLLSPALLDEYRAVLLRPRLVKLHGLSARQVDEILATLAANSLWREASQPAQQDTPESPDPGDQHLWDLLACEPRAVLITGDKLLLKSPPNGRRLIAPAQW